MRTVCDDATFLQNMLDFEAALARAEATSGVIPTAAGDIQGRVKPNHLALLSSRMPQLAQAIWLFPW